MKKMIASFAAAAFLLTGTAMAAAPASPKPAAKTTTMKSHSMMKSGSMMKSHSMMKSTKKPAAKPSSKP